MKRFYNYINYVLMFCLLLLVGTVELFNHSVDYIGKLLKNEQKVRKETKVERTYDIQFVVSDEFEPEMRKIIRESYNSSSNSIN